MKIFQGLVEPDITLDFKKQVEDCILKLSNWLKLENITTDKIVSVNVFLKALSNTGYYAKRKEIKKQLELKYGAGLPVAYLAQPPANSSELALEIHVLKGNIFNKIIQKTVGNNNYIVAFDENCVKYVFASGIEDLDSINDIQTCSERVFQKMEKILKNEGMEFSSIFRQWNYIENIILEENTSLGLKQHYQIFNDVRSKYYQKCKFTHGYPAATGIGTNAGGTIVSFYAVSESPKIAVAPIDNPLQVSAFNYNSEVLVGEANDKKTGKTSPKFVRAKYIGNSDGETIFVSGTASIRGEYTVAIGDVENQTRITLENIEALITPENLIKSNIQNNGKEPRVAFLRGYVKNISDNKVLMNICKEKYPNIPIILVHSDICRENLLLEFEATVGFNDSGSAR